MYSTELVGLNVLIERAVSMAAEGTPDGRSAMQGLADELVEELARVSPAHHADTDYRRAVAALERLRAMIRTEALLAGDPDATLS
jgi:hypothetical protein